jgi:SpoVK/Ycf46/Vps4 family AAA+-type ATPase
MLINKDTRTMVMLKTFNDKKEPLFEITFYYDITRGEFSTFFNMDELLEYEVKLKKSGINLVKVEMGHMDTEEYEMNVPDIDLELNYGTEFLKVHEVILKRLNKPNDKGIILFHGDPGTGKTSYIKYLTRLITDKEILFIPPSMAESLSEPSIIPFLMEHKNSVLIVEDAERVIADREGNGSSMGVSNILNLTDGILGDCLNIQVIATFNMKREKIDQALLRKGRLIAEHKFSKLTIDESNNLLKHIGKEGEVTESMTLADIYNIDEELFKVDDKLKIGFK